MYVNYTICSVLLFISMKRIYYTIKQTLTEWTPNRCEITLHVIAFAVPVIVLTAILLTSDSNRILIVNSDNVVQGSNINNEVTHY